MVQDLVSKNNVDQIPKPHCIHNLISPFTILLVLAHEVRVNDRYSKTKRGRQLFSCVFTLSISVQIFSRKEKGHKYKTW